ncbi:MAG: DCC1-like thiol-disulfide oxidoreductase family protein [Luteolibacter sp.]
MGWVLFYDGDCAFCSRSVRNVVRFDHREVISFAPLQGKFSREKGFTKYAAADSGTMVLLRESDGRIFTHSDGLIEIARIFGGWWRILALARFIPKPLRDAVYRTIARNRYRIMGKADHCALPDPALLKRLRE